MKCDIIIPVWNQFKLTAECIKSIIEHTHYPYRLIIIDNGSAGDVKEYLRTLAAETDTRLIRNNENLGFVRAINQGLEASEAPYICIMNNDTIATDGWLSEMIAVSELDDKIGLVNPSSNNLGQHKGKDTLEDYSAKLKRFSGQYIEMGAAIGFCMLFKRRLFEKIGYLNEIYCEGNFDDTDYSRKAEKEGYRSVRAKGAYVYHHIKSSFRKVKNYEEAFKRNQGIYNRHWGRPKRLLYILSKSHGKLFDWMSNEILKKARGGNWVYLFFKKGETLPEIQEHSNMRVEYMPGMFFEASCLFKILKKKKHFDSIFVDDKALVHKIKRYEKFHKAETTLIGG